MIKRIFFVVMVICISHFAYGKCGKGAPIVVKGPFVVKTKADAFVSCVSSESGVAGNRYKVKGCMLTLHLVNSEKVYKLYSKDCSEEIDGKLNVNLVSVANECCKADEKRRWNLPYCEISPVFRILDQSVESAVACSESLSKWKIEVK